MSLSRSNILISHSFIRNNVHETQTIMSIAPYTNILIDSGAFTNYKIKTGKVKMSGMTEINEYIAACKKYYHPNAWGYITLDVVRDVETTNRNLKQMQDEGLTPIPVITPNDTVDRVLDYIENQERVAISGTVVNSSLERSVGRIQKAFSISKGKALVHVLGFGIYPAIFQAPIATSDVSSMNSGSRFGSIIAYDKYKGLKTIHWQGLTKNPELVSYLKRIGISIVDLKNQDNYRTSFSISTLLSVYAYVQFANHCAENNIGLFFALPNSAWISVTAATYYGAAQEEGKFNYYAARDKLVELRAIGKQSKEKYYEKIVECFTAIDYKNNPITNDAQHQKLSERFGYLLKNEDKNEKSS